MKSEEVAGIASEGCVAQSAPTYFSEARGLRLATLLGCDAGMIEARINDPSNIDRNAVRAIIEAGRTPTIQFSKPGYSPELLRKVNDACGEFGETLEVRFYGHYGGQFDAGVLAHIPDASWLSVDCLTEIVNERQIAKLSSLKRLSFGVYKFDDPKFLEQLDVGKLDRLALVENAKRNLDLSPLRNANALETLFLNGFTRNIESIAGLSKLARLTLSGIAKNQNLRFVGAIPNLRSFALILGGRQSIDEIVHPRLEELSVVRVRGLERLGAIGRFPSLRELTVEDQLQVRSIDVSGSSLRKLVLINCKNLEEVQGLEYLSDLIEFRTSRTKLDLESLLERHWPSSLEVLGLYSSSQKWNDATRATLNRRGFREFASR